MGGIGHLQIQSVQLSKKSKTARRKSCRKTDIAKKGCPGWFSQFKQHISTLFSAFQSAVKNFDKKEVLRSVLQLCCF